MPKVVPRTKEGKDIDKFFKRITGSIKAGDVVIPVLGPTGPGKSTVCLARRLSVTKAQVLLTILEFINNVLGPKAKMRAKVSDGLASCTRTCEMFTVDGPVQRNADYRTFTGRLILIDTPGFDDSRMSDSEVVDEITKSLSSLHSKKGVAIAGIVYMLPIYPGRATASSESNMKAFEKVYSQMSSSIVALVTTRWDLCAEAPGAKREEELRKSMWGKEARADAVVLRLRDHPESAWAVVDAIIHKFAEKRSSLKPVASATKAKNVASSSKPSKPKPAKKKPNAATSPPDGVTQAKGATVSPSTPSAPPAATQKQQQQGQPLPPPPPKQGIFGRLINALLSLIGKKPAADKRSAK